MSELDAYYTGGPKTWQEAFPPVCIKAHNNPTLMSKYILPAKVRQHDYALDPRPSTRICTSYYTTSPGDAPLDIQEEEKPEVPQAFLADPFGQPKESDVLPLGGAAGRGFPYQIYANNIDVEGDLYRLGEPLTKCAERRYTPHALPVQTNVVPGANFTNASSLSPYVTEVRFEAGCRKADDELAWNRSSRLFFNPTRLDRDPNTRRVEGRNVLECPK
jgi:hypothetical protein